MGDLNSVLDSVKQAAQAPPEAPAAPPTPPDAAPSGDVPGFQDALKGKTTASAQPTAGSEDDIMRSMLQKRQAMTQSNSANLADALETIRTGRDTRIADAFGHGTLEAAQATLSQPRTVSETEVQEAVPFKGEHTWMNDMNTEVVREAIRMSGQAVDFGKLIVGLASAPFEGGAQALEKLGEVSGTKIPGYIADEALRDPAFMMMLHQVAPLNINGVREMVEKPPLSPEVYKAIDNGIIEPTDPALKAEAMQHANDSAVRLQAEQEALRAPETTPPQKEPFTPSQPTAYDIARQDNPELFGEYDPLVQRRDAYTQTFNELLDKRRADAEESAPHNAEIAELEEKRDSANARKAKIYQDRIDDLKAKNEDYVDEQMDPRNFDEDIKNVRGELSRISVRAGHLESGVRDALSEASKKIPPAEEAAPAASKGFEPTSGHYGEFKDDEGQPIPETPPEKTDAIASKISTDLQAAGRPKEEADAHGQIAASFYKTMAEVYGGKRGTAEDWFGREGAAIKPGGEGKTIRGSYKPATGTAKATIRLLKSANATTFIHENAHHFLGVMDRYAKQEDAPQRLKDDYDAVRKWLGVKEGEDLFGKNEKGRFTFEKLQERFAKGFENYIREGVAPNPALAGVFAKLGAWFKNIYKAALKLDVPLTDEVRGVFDRLLAIDPEKTTITPEREPPAKTPEPEPITPPEHKLVPEKTQGTQPSQAKEKVSSAEKPPASGGKEGEEPIKNKSVPAEKLRDKAGNIRMENLTNDNDIRASLRLMASKTPLLDHAVVGDVEVAAFARELGKKGTPDIVDKLRSMAAEDGVPLAAYVRAAREHLAQADDEARAFAAKVDKGTEADFHNAMLAQDRFMMIAATVSETANELGRAMRAFQDITGMKNASVDELQELFQRVGSSVEEKKQLFKLIASKSAPGLRGQSAKVMQAAAKPGFWDTFAEYRRCSILSGWVTHSLWLAGTGVNLVFKPLVLDTLGGLHNEIGKLMGRPDTGSQVFGGIKGLANAIARSPNIISATGTAARTGRTVLRPFEGQHDTWLATGGIRKVYNVDPEVLRKAVDQSFNENDHDDLKALRAHLDKATAQGDTVKADAVKEILDRKTEKRKADLTGIIAAAMQNKIKTWGEVAGEMHDFATSVLSGIEATGKNLVSPEFYKDKPLLGAQREVGTALPNIQVKGVNVLPVGSAMRGVSNRIYSTMHTFAREVGAYIEIPQELRRIAVEEGKTGDDIETRYHELLASPTPEAMQRVTKIVNKQTLMSNESSFAKVMTNLRNKLDAWTGTKAGSILFPVISVPAEATSQVVVDFSPLGLASAAKRATLKGEAGGLEQERAQVKMLAGTAIIGLGYWLGQQGITTPSPSVNYKKEEERRNAGQQSGSVRLGDWMVSLAHVPVIGTILTTGSDLSHISDIAMSKDESEKLKPAITSAVNNFFFHENSIAGMTDLIDAIRGGKDPMNYLKNQADALVPQFIKQTNDVLDPLQRDSRGFMASLISRIPFESEGSAPRINALTGEPLEREPYHVHTAQPDAVAENLLKLSIYPANPRSNINGVDLDPKQAAEYSSAKGHILYSGLQTLMEGDGREDYEAADNDGKRKMVRRIETHAANCSKSIMFNKYPELLKDANDKFAADCAQDTAQ